MSKFRIEVVQDEDPQNPRTEWDNQGKMVCFHKRHQLGDKHDLRPEDFTDLVAVEAHLRKERGAAVILPLFLYDHGGLTINTTGFSCPWDSGQVGFIYATRADLLKEYGSKRLTARIKKMVTELLEAEVKAYDQYLTGDVWGYRIFKGDSDEEVDGCWGFYGEEYCREQAAAVVKALEEKEEPLFAALKEA